MDEYIFEKEFLGRGLHFPVGIDPVTGRISTSSYEESIKESIYLILMTRKGERVMQPDFGCGIQDYVFESMDYGTLSKMSTSVTNALIMWEPRIDEVEVNVVPSAAETGMVEIRISYVVRSTNNPYNLVYPFYLNEGLITLDSAEKTENADKENPKDTESDDTEKTGQENKAADKEAVGSEDKETDNKETDNKATESNVADRNEKR